MFNITGWTANNYNIHCVHPPPPPFLLGEVEPPIKSSKQEPLTGPQFLEGGWWERGGDLFQQKTYIWGALPKKGGGLGQFADLNGGLVKKRVCF